MARGDATARQAETSGVNYSQNLQGQQNQLYSTLAPTLQQDIAHPVGLNPYEKAQANTAAQESAGGSQAAAVGQGALQAQRTRNAGTADAAIGEGSRGAGRNLSRAALGTELQDSAMKQQKQQAAKGELASLYGVATPGGSAALNSVANNSNANTNAANASWNWAKYILDPALQAGGSAAGGYLNRTQG